MTRAERIANLAGVVIPFLGLIVAVILLWNRVVDAIDLALFVLMYALSGLGVTVGFHRLLTHRSFRTYKPVEYAFATLGSLSVQG
jgi:stearoyl-CoA desaturase (Delta-9 desaturase)